MKKISLIALLLVVALLPLAAFGCGKKTVKYNVTVTVNDPEDEKSPYIDAYAFTIEVKEGYKPTVLDAVREACQKYEYKFEASEDGLSVFSIEDVKEFDTEENGNVVASSYWTFLLNGVEPKTGRAGNTEITDGDVIVINFVTDKY